MADGTDPIGQDEIEELLRQTSRAAAEPGGPIGQDEVEELLRQAAAADSSRVGGARETRVAEAARGQAEAGADGGRLEPQSPAAGPVPKSAAGAGSHPDDDMELLLAQAERAIRSIDEPVESRVPHLQPFELQDLTGARPNAERASLDLLRDVELDLRIELGRTQMYLEDVLRLRKGSVVPLDKLAGDPVDVFVNGRLVARGEVLVLNDNFCVRIADLVYGEEMA
ncbi:MAG: flagellar motor switch protein FliN [Planctomycetes bacterium]|nr:flagellar motor switch protein FliN [Planctomycetota bacterium]